MTRGKSKAKVCAERDITVTFADAAGVDEAKEELKEVVAFLRNPQLYGRLGARFPKGILLIGPPGTGKTLLARAVAGEAGVPLFSMNGSDFVETFVVGAARVRDLFDEANKAKPSIVFIDEVAALRRRGPPGVFGGGEKEQVLDLLLAALDSFDFSEGVVLLAATNRPEMLEPALLRAGRFDRQVSLDLPDRSSRLAILHVHIQTIRRLTADIDLKLLAALTPGFTGADLATLVNEAALLATRHGAMEVGMADFTDAVKRIVTGPAMKSRVLDQHERQIVAYHEIGHSLVAAALPGMDPIHNVSIIPRGISYPIQWPTEDRFLQTTDNIQDRMAVLMGGRAAEQLVFRKVSTAAADDLARVTDMARLMVAGFGMARRLGQVVYERDGQAPLGAAYSTAGLSYSQETAREIEMAMRDLVDDAFERARSILAKRRPDLDRGAELLLQLETITAADFPPMVGNPLPARTNIDSKAARKSWKSWLSDWPWGPGRKD